MDRYVLNLDSKLALQEIKAGGKGAGLAWLRRNGFNVPPGFIITPEAFQDFLAELDIGGLAQIRTWTQGDLERIHEFLLACVLPDRLAHSIVRAYRHQGGRVAIRSSMVGEDTSVASFAGQLDTLLNVEGEEKVLGAVKECWASLFNWRLLKYLNERESLSLGKMLECFSIAVIVQRMVDARAAGVAFSADPVTGQHCVVIEAACGLGDAVVRGLVEADRYIVDTRGILTEARPVCADQPVLDEQQILRLADVVRAVSRKARVPQDIEWAWDGTDFHLLQSRPITSLVGQKVYSNRLVSDMSPGLVKPLVWSTNTMSMARSVFKRIFTELIGPNDVDFDLLVKLIRSRIYVNVTLIGELFERIGLPANLFEMVARDERAEHRFPPLTLKTAGAMLRLARFARRHSRVANEITAFVTKHDQELEPFRRADWSSVAPRGLLTQFDQLARLHAESQWFVFIGPINMMIRNRLLNHWVRRRAKDLVPSDLVRGRVGLKALEPNDELYHLAAQARSLGGGIEALLMEENDASIRAALADSEQGRALVRNVDAFLKRFGFLSVNGTDFSSTPWIEMPTLIWQAIGRVASCPAQSEAESVTAIREEARRRVRSRLNWVERQVFDRLLASTITYIDLRERTSLMMSQDSYQMRRIFLALADHLVACGALEQRGDVFYLMYAEIRQLVEGSLESEAARRLVNARKAEMDADAQIVPPDTVCGDYVPTCPSLPTEGLKYLVGISGSSGVAHGYARIVFDPTQAPVTLTRKDILVVPFTDVGWTPLFSAIGGIVAETGGQLSHTSIVAREYGLPAVVSIKRATQLIQTGQPITVDGDKGWVYLE